LALGPGLAALPVLALGLAGPLVSALVAVLPVLGERPGLAALPVSGLVLGLAGPLVSALGLVLAALLFLAPGLGPPGRPPVW
jgi:hypothetical protein